MKKWYEIKDEIVKYAKDNLGDNIEYVSFPTNHEVKLRLWNRDCFEQALLLLNDLTKEFNNDLLNLYTRDKIICDIRLNSVTYELSIQFSR